MVSELRKMMPDCEYFVEPKITKKTSDHRRLSRSVTPDNYPKQHRINRLQPLEGSKRARDLEKAEEDRRSRASSTDVSIDFDVMDSESVSRYTLKSSKATDDNRTGNRTNGSSKSADSHSASTSARKSHKDLNRSRVHGHQSRDTEMKSIKEESIGVAVIGDTDC